VFMGGMRSLFFACTFCDYNLLAMCILITVENRDFYNNEKSGVYKAYVSTSSTTHPFVITNPVQRSGHRERSVAVHEHREYFFRQQASLTFYAKKLTFFVFTYIFSRKAQ